MNEIKWVYIKSEPGLWTVGFYDPSGKWQSDSDHNDREAAAQRVHWLNGGIREQTEEEQAGMSYMEYWHGRKPKGDK